MRPEDCGRRDPLTLAGEQDLENCLETFAATVCTFVVAVVDMVFALVEVVYNEDLVAAVALEKEISVAVEVVFESILAVVADWWLRQ